MNWEENEEQRKKEGYRVEEKRVVEEYRVQEYREQEEELLSVEDLSVEIPLSEKTVYPVSGIHFSERGRTCSDCRRVGKRKIRGNEIYTRSSSEWRKKNSEETVL